MDYDDLVRCSVMWYPEDMALSSEAFFEGLKHSLNEGEYEAAMRLLLELREAGLMDVGISSSSIENS